MPLRLLGLAAAVLIVSTAALLIRFALAAGAQPLAIAAARLTLAAAVVLPLALLLRRAELGGLQRPEALRGGAAGVFLALHFAAWIASLQYTSVASSVALVTTNPVWVGLLSWLLLSERPSARAFFGIALAALGSLLILLADQAPADQSAAAPLLGNSLALAGAMAISGYFLVGRRLAGRISLLAYVALVYSAAAIVLNLLSAVAGQGLWTIPPAAWIPLLGLALGPQLIGHTLLNASLRHLSATFVAIAILGEPVGSALLAWWILNEPVTPLQALGALPLLLGIVVAATGERPGSPAKPAP